MTRNYEISDDQFISISDNVTDPVFSFAKDFPDF